MWEFTKGALLAIVVNALTLLGWWYMGMWAPSIFNVLSALIVLGFYGLEDQWAFPMGYWAVELLAVVAWLTGFGWVARGGIGT